MKAIHGIIVVLLAGFLITTSWPLWHEPGFWPIQADPEPSPTIDPNQGTPTPGPAQPPTPQTPPNPPPTPTSPPGPVMKFGISHGSLEQQTILGIQPDYASEWIGAWTLTNGWRPVDQALHRMRAANITPALHFYYWGDDIQPACFQDGCWSELHDAYKDNHGWYALAGQLVDHLDEHMGGEPVLILLESEFNKQTVQTYEELDGRLADMANFLHERYPAARVVLSFGNWNPAAWTTWDRAAEASDAIGLQAVRGSTHDSADDYQTLYEETLQGAKELQRLFAKPVILTDLALSSYPEDEFAQPQADAVQELLAGLDALEEAGVEAILYRSWRDTPTMDPANRYGPAERHWGLVDARGQLKPAAHAWIAGVLAERGDPEFRALFEISNNINEWWVEVRVVGNHPVEEVWVMLPDHGAKALARNGWGSWSGSVHIFAGTEVRFVAVDGLGEVVEGGVVVWGG